MGETVIDKNQETKQRILYHLQQGLFFKDACVAAGSSERSGHRWKSEDGSFGSQVEASIVSYKQKLIKCINQGALKNPRIALEVLKIRWPEEWNPTKKIQIYDPEEEIKRINRLIYGDESLNKNSN